MGSDPSADLVLTDPKVAPRHLRIELDGADFRWEAGPELRDVRVDRSWMHPESKLSGGKVQLGDSELLVFAGELTEGVVSHELRSPSGIEAPDAAAATDVGDRPPGLDALLDVPGSSHDAQTMALGALNLAGMDAIALAAIPTQAKPNTPQLLSQQSTRILGRDQLADSSRTPAPRPITPEIIPVIEPDAASSVRARNAWGDRPPSAVSAEAPTPTKNAWGDQPKADERAMVHVPASPANAWGDAPKSSRGAISVPPEIPRSAWDSARVAKPATEPPGPRESFDRASARSSGTRASDPREGLPRLEIAPEALISGRRDPALRVLTEPDGPYATQVRLLGARLAELFRSFGYRAFMMTSPEPLTGKTTIALNLALALAEDPKRRVALVETNFRFPRLAEILGLPPDRGLIGVLEGRLELLDVTARLKDRNLVVLPAGGRHAHPGEILTSPRLKALLRDLLNTVDIAILDAPSVKPTADTNLVSGLVDGALMVALDGVTTTRLTDLAIQQLGREHVLGGLYNHAPPEISRQLRAERKLRIS